jgi:zinc protease
VIGFQQDIETYSLNDLRVWYEKYYAPNNATLVVVGDVNPVKVVALAKQYFGDYAFNPNIKPSNRTATTLRGNSKVLKLKAELPFYVLSFPAPSLKTATDKSTPYKLEMLAYVLDNGLSKSLIRNQQIASSIGVGYRLYDKYDTLFTLSFIPASGVSNDTVLKAIKTQVDELINNPDFIQGELSRTKAQLEADFIFEQDQISTQSYYLGMLSTVGLGIDKMFTYVDNMNSISATEVSAIAKHYLNFDDANSVELIPQGVK